MLASSMVISNGFVSQSVGVHYAESEDRISTFNSNLPSVPALRANGSLYLANNLLIEGGFRLTFLSSIEPDRRATES